MNEPKPKPKNVEPTADDASQEKQAESLSPDELEGVAGGASLAAEPPSPPAAAVNYFSGRLLTAEDLKNDSTSTKK